MRWTIVLLIAVISLFGKVDINSASIKELSTLKGIGETKAKAIVEYRKQQCFKSVDELTKVKGIGKATLGKNKSNLEAKSCKK